jgi:hypothetical protein
MRHTVLFWGTERSNRIAPQLSTNSSDVYWVVMGEVIIKKLPQSVQGISCQIGNIHKSLFKEEEKADLSVSKHKMQMPIIGHGRVHTYPFTPPLISMIYSIFLN